MLNHHMQHLIPTVPPSAGVKGNSTPSKVNKLSKAGGRGSDVDDNVVKLPEGLRIRSDFAVFLLQKSHVIEIIRRPLEQKRLDRKVDDVTVASDSVLQPTPRNPFLRSLELSMPQSLSFEEELSLITAPTLSEMP